jgi:mRNA interferase MazF
VGRFVKGDVVVLPFPFSDLSATKRRPALVIGEPGGVDLIFCMITSQNPRNQYGIELTNVSMKEGYISQASWIRVDRIFSGDSSLVLKKIGAVSDDKMQQVVAAIHKLIS